ncbi:FtsX-like permease family protein [Bifidobacterium amazonense]|uniref:FtsX-like permease family protein n=1 Tax=Bifidobacterium amazonense TaxID=2809027 RepID=A0ABS9VY00_9BIFI|nr:FtsX-like permease family protein [Bifidobacterium amazonense]MCH9276943.1 FtsX-like permease family protein [Bifidobacterium amazonense]
MFSITLKLMRKSARMLIPAGIAILIGTAFICATFLFSNTMTDALGRQQTGSYGGANYVVTLDSDTLKSATDEEKSAAWSTTVGDFHLDQVAATDGVDGVRAGTVTDITVVNGGKNVSGIALGTAKDQRLLPVGVADGDLPADNGEIALPESVAKQLGVHVGDTVDVTSLSMQETAGTADGTTQSDGDDRIRVRVTGLTDDTNGVYGSYGGASVVSDNVLAALQAVDDFSQVCASQLFLDLAGGGDGTNGSASDPARAQATADAVAKLLPRHYRILSREAANQEAIKALSVDGGTDITTTFLLSFGVLAMFVAALVIANTFQVLVAQRRRTLALLRTIGAKKGQLYGSVLFEAGVLGLVASALGVVLGCALIGGLCASGLMASTGMDARFVASWQAFVVPVAFGIVMTVLASLGSARSATSVTPLEALRPIELTDTRRAGLVRGVIAVLLVLVGLAFAVFAAWQMHESIAGGGDSMVSDAYATVLLMAIFGCALIFLGLVLSAVFWLPVLMRGVGALVALAGPSAKIAHANIQKNPRRVAATGAALLIGVTLVATIATGATSAKQTMGEALDKRFSVDMIADGTDMTDTQAADAAKVKGVAASVYAPTAMMYTQDEDGNGMSVLLVGVDDANALRSVMKADLKGVSIGDGTVLMPKYDVFTGKALAFGDGTVTFSANPVGDDGAAASDGTASSDTTAAPDKQLTLKPTLVDYRRVSENYNAVAFVSATHFTNGDLKATGHMLLMKIDADTAGVALNDVLGDVQQAFTASPGVQVTGPIAERSIWETMINGLMALLVGLIAVAVLIALVGVANTLSLSVIERTRESATLRAIGMTRGQLRRSLAVEALLLSLVSGVAGVLLGTAFGWFGSYMVFSLYGDVVFPFDWTANGIMLGVAALAALIASIAPAHRAVSTPPVEALAEA